MPKTPWKSLWFFSAALACQPTLPKSNLPEDAVVAIFEPNGETPKLPLPNDLALDESTGLIHVPEVTDPTNAEKEYYDYLRTLDGFPITVTATAAFSRPLDPASVTPQAVRVYDVSDEKAPRVLPTEEQLATCRERCASLADDVACSAKCPTELAPRVAWNAQKNQVEVTAPWESAKTYAVVLLSGPSGLVGENGATVFAAPAFVFLRSENRLVTCVDLLQPNCRPTSSLISGATLEESRDRALVLERARRKLKPALDALVKTGVARTSVVSGWTFTTVKMPLATFEPKKDIVPFPNDLLMHDGKVRLPLSASDSELATELKTALNQLDGFSTTASFFTETSKTLGAASSRLDVFTLNKSQFLVFNLDNPSEAVPFSVTCRGCAHTSSQRVPEPDQIVLTPQKPLRPGTRYGVLWLRGATNLLGREVNAGPLFALLRLASPLYLEGKSTLRSLSNDEAQDAESLRQKLQPLFQAADTLNLARTDIVLGWMFRTQTTSLELTSLAYKPTLWDLPTAVEGGPGRLLTVPLNSLQLVTQLTGRDFHSHLRWIKEGEFVSGNALDETATELNFATGQKNSTEGAFTEKTLSAPRLEKRRFLLSAPKVSKYPDGRIPVVIFQHGYGQSRRDAALIANTLAREGLAVLSIDAPFHGTRSYCRADADCRASSGCENHRCRDDLLDTTDGYTVGSFSTPFGNIADPLETPMISGDSFLSNSNVMATRDHLRQHVIDVAQLIRVLQDTEAGIGAIDMKDSDNTVAEKLDVSQPGFIGQSLGGILGSLLTAALPEIPASVLNVPGASLVDILSTSTLFETEKKQMDDYLASQGMVVGTQAYEEYLDTLRWALDPADPQNYGRHLIAEPLKLQNSTTPLPSKRVFISWVKDDEVVPNPTTELLIRSIETGTFVDYLKTKEYPNGGHGFLLTAFSQSSADLALAAQTEAMEWVKP